MKNIDKIKRFSNKFIILGVMLIIFFGLVLGYLSAELYNKYDESKNIAKDQNITKVNEVSVSDIRLNESATIVYNRVYVMCNELNREQKNAEENMIGKNKSELEELLVGWNIVEFTPDQLMLEKTIDSYSPQYYKIGLYDNSEGETMVAVYTFDIDGNEVLEDVTGTPLALLHDSEASKLKEGNIVKGKEKLYEILENYDE